MTGSQNVSAPASVFQRWGRRGTAIVLTLGAVVLLLVGATVGLVLANTTTSDSQLQSIPPQDGIDVGFLRDMIVHHDQGVLMAHIVQGAGGSPDVAGVAYDIEYQQTQQIGQMGGFLLLWDYSRNSLTTPMAWMATADTDHGSMAGMTDMVTTQDPALAAAGAVMPGMATTAEIAQLQELHGAGADVLFLQLMIRHHQGGIGMMEVAAADAINPQVRGMAQKMVDSQEAEIKTMTTMLEPYGAVPLPWPQQVGDSVGPTTITASPTDTDLTDADPTTGTSTDDMPGMTSTTGG